MPVSVQIMACRLWDSTPVSEPYCLLLIEPLGTNVSEIWIEMQQLSYEKNEIEEVCAMATLVW